MRTAKMAKLWAVIAAGSVAVAACSSSASPSAASPAGSAAASAQASASAPAEKVTINFPYLWGGPEGQALEKVITAFNTSQDHITVKGVSSPDFQKQLASMSGSNGFDISDNFGSTVGSWASKGILEPLDDYMKADNFDTADFVPTALQSNQYQGKTYALPIAVHTLLLMYNKKMFSDAGIAAPPTTMSDLQADIAKLTKADSSGKITQLGMRSPDYITLAYAFGGKWYDDQGNPTPDDPGNLAALHFWVDNFVKKYGAANRQETRHRRPGRNGRGGGGWPDGRVRHTARLAPRANLAAAHGREAARGSPCSSSNTRPTSTGVSWPSRTPPIRRLWPGPHSSRAACSSSRRTPRTSRKPGRSSSTSRARTR